MKRKFKIFWCVFAPLVLIGGLIYFLLDISWMSFLIWLGMCIVINLPMFVMAIIEDATGSGRIITFIIFILFSPIFLLIRWFYTVKGLKRGNGGKRYSAPSSPSYNTPSYDDDEDEVAVDDRKRDNSVFRSAMEKAVDRAITSAKRCGTGYYGEVSNWNINYNVTHIFGIHIYGSITYRISNYKPNYPESGYQDDLNNVLEALNEELESAVEREVERVQSEYKGFDHDWNLSINIEGKLKIN